MCELLGLSADHSVGFSGSLARLAAHGSPTGRNHDGWGVAAYEGADVRIVKEAAPAADSAWVRFVETHGVASPLVIAHIRHASEGAPRYANTHPFARELGGRMHVFAHNGTLRGIRDTPLASGGPQPLGETDSEYAFCLLLARMHALGTGGRHPTIAERRATVTEFAAGLRPLGPANFLYADGELLFAHGDRRQGDDGRTSAPGLHFIERPELPTDPSWLVSGVRLGSRLEPAAIVASVPLTEEPWHPVREGELMVLSRGRLLAE
jgi:glutamine amidotransferase